MRWLNGDKNIYAMCDENHGLDVKVLDVSDLNDIQVKSLFNSQMMVMRQIPLLTMSLLEIT